MRAFLIKSFVALMGAGMMAVAGSALACNGGCAPPAPPSPPHNPNPPKMPCNCDHGGGHGGGNVNVNVNVKANASASAFGGASAGATYYGGYGNWSQSQGIPQPAGALNVVTGDEAAYEAYQEERRLTRMMILQASCIDDTGVPHPASQLNGDRNVDDGYAGEIYRCIAGTHMQVVMIDCGGPIDAGYEAANSESDSYSESETSDSWSQGMGHDGHEHHEHHNAGGSHHGDMAAGGMNGAASCAGMDFSHIDFGGGQTMSCQKGEALWFEHGLVTCRVQIQQRQCNERSLLRRFGTGIKVLTLTRVEKITKRREVARASSASYGSTVMTFDGGVGGFVQ